MVQSNGVEATVLKARWGNDIRKSILHHSHDLSYNDLVLMMQRIFKIKASANLVLKYKDSDGDQITLTDDNDVALALRTEQALFITIYSDGEDIPTQTRRLEEQLVAIHDSAAQLLETLKNVNAIAEPPVFGVGGSERPDTPNQLSESVATIQPSIHEQVNNGPLASCHPPAPSLHDERSLVESVNSSQADPGAHQISDAPVPPSAPLSTSCAEKSASEPSEMGDNNQFSNVYLSPQPNELPEVGVPPSDAVVSSSGGTANTELAPAAPLLSTHMGPAAAAVTSPPSAPPSCTPSFAPPLPTLSQGKQVSQNAAPPSSFVLPQMGSMQTSQVTSSPVPQFGAVPTSQVTAPPTSQFGAPPVSQFSAPPVSQFSTPTAHQFGVPPTSKFGATPASQFGAQPTCQFGVPPTSQQYTFQQQPQQQPLQMSGFTAAGPTPPSAPPVNPTPPPTNLYGAGTAVSGANTPSSTPAPFAPSNPSPAPALQQAYGHPPSNVPYSTAAYGGMAQAGLPQGAPSGTVPSAFAAPPVMSFSTQGVNPFVRPQGAQHYIRPSFTPSAFQQ